MQNFETKKSSFPNKDCLRSLNSIKTISAHKQQQK